MEKWIFIFLSFFWQCGFVHGQGRSPAIEPVLEFDRFQKEGINPLPPMNKYDFDGARKAQSRIFSGNSSWFVALGLLPFLFLPIILWWVLFKDVRAKDARRLGTVKKLKGPTPSNEDDQNLPWAS